MTEREHLEVVAVRLEADAADILSGTRREAVETRARAAAWETMARVIWRHLDGRETNPQLVRVLAGPIKTQ